MDSREKVLRYLDIATGKFTDLESVIDALMMRDITEEDAECLIDLAPVFRIP